jgi:hypothetical protein
MTKQNPNRHERRKAMVVETKEMTPAEFLAMNSICAWDGCMATCDSKRGTVYLPDGWSALLLYWSKEAPRNIFDIPASDMIRDAVLCPVHTALLDGQLKPLPNRLLTRGEAKGNA